MTFSPEDAYASNVPVPDDNQFNTGGLELAPLEGEGEGANPLEGYTAEEQAADAEKFAVTPKNEQVSLEQESPESAPENSLSKQEALDLRIAAKNQEEISIGEVKAALMSGNVEAAQAAFAKVIEARIQQAEFTIASLEADFASGNFQNRGNSEDPSVKSIYESQVASQREAIAWHMQRLAYSETEPKQAFAAEGWESLEGNNDAAYEIRQLIRVAEGYQAEEKNGSSFAPYTGELTGMINSSLADKNMSQDLKSAIKEAGRKITNLPADVKQKIADLN